MKIQFNFNQKQFKQHIMKIIKAFRKRMDRKLFMKIYFSYLNNPSNKNISCSYMFAIDDFNKIKKLLSNRE